MLSMWFSLKFPSQTCFSLTNEFPNRKKQKMLFQYFLFTLAISAYAAPSAPTTNQANEDAFVATSASMYSYVCLLTIQR
jgi:hypothetical protein